VINGIEHRLGVSTSQRDYCTREACYLTATGAQRLNPIPQIIE